MTTQQTIRKDFQFYKFCLYGFLKNQRFYEPFLLLIFLQTKGLSFSQIGTLYSIRFILRALFEIPSGLLADALGRKGIMLFAYAMYIGSFLGYYLANTYYWLWIPTALFALGDAFRTGTHKAMIFEYLKHNGMENLKVAYYGHTRSWSQTGSAISSLVAMLLILASHNYNVIFLYSLIPYLLGFVLLASYPSYLEGTDSLTHPDKKPPTLVMVFKDMVSSFRSLSSLRLSMNVSSFTGFYFAAKDYLQVFLSLSVASIPIIANYSGSVQEKEVLLIGPAYFVIYLFTALASLKSSKLCSLFSSYGRYMNLLLLGGLACSLVAGLLSGMKLSLWASCCFILILAIENARRPAGVALMAESFNPRILATVLSIESQLSSVLASGLSLIIGILADRIGPGYALSGSALLLLLLYPLIRIKYSSSFS